ncbi:hypothetical protein BJV77DRAFT_966436 [Russula vinacea]|nr:hypothetical protein BJV77DRAFT_966436 [Russula vinacea]
MDERDIRNLNLPQGSTRPYTVVESISSGEGGDILRTGHSDSQLPNLLSSNFFYPPRYQAAHYSGPLHPHWDPSYWPLTTRPTVLSPEQIPETSIPMTLAPGLSDESLEDGFGAFADNQIRVNGGWPITDRDSLGETHGQSSRVSLQQLEDMPGTHPFEHYPDRGVEAPEFVEFQWIPEMGIARKNRIRDSKQWKCHYDGCNKSYGRRQEAKRHMRDNMRLHRSASSVVSSGPGQRR